MSKYILTLLTFFFLINRCFSQETSVFYSVGGIYSDLDVSIFEKEGERLRGRESNTGKHSIYNSIGIQRSFANIVRLELAFDYQERFPLEKFTFGVQSGLGGIHEFSQWPSSPQSILWDSEKHLRFPNFKYFHLELIPMIQFNKKLSIALGIGIFYGALLNQKELVFGRADFPSVDFLFESPFYVGGEVSYRKNDFGWIPKCSVSLPIKEKIKIGFSCKSYVSESALFANDIGAEPYGRKQNNTWLVFTYGFEISYLLNKKDILK